MLIRSTRALSFLGALLLSASTYAQAPAPAPVQAPAVDPPEYRAIVDEAVREFSSGHWDEARALFKSAHGVAPNARTLRGMGMAAYELRMYVQAIRELDAALADQRKPLDADKAAQVRQLIAKAHEFVGRLHVTLDPPEARLLIDGKVPTPEGDGSFLLDLGTHVLSATAEHYKSSNVRQTIEGGAEQTVRIQLEPMLGVAGGVPPIDPNAPPEGASKQPEPAAPPPKPAEDSNLDTYGWIALGGAAAFGITSAAFWVIGGGQYDDVKAECMADCSNAQISDSGVETSDTLTTVFMALAIASGATAGVLFILDASSDSNSDDAAKASSHGSTLALRVGPTALALDGRF